MISYTTGEPLGNLESGLAAAPTGSVRIAIVSGGVACLAGAVAVALSALWRYDARAVSKVRDHRRRRAARDLGVVRLLGLALRLTFRWA
jgi:hypothetical protein